MRTVTADFWPTTADCNELFELFVCPYLCPSLMLMMIMMMIVATENLLFGCYAIFCFIDVLLRIKSMMINS